MGEVSASLHWYVFDFFFFNDTATTEIYTLSLHDALPICAEIAGSLRRRRETIGDVDFVASVKDMSVDRKSTRLNSSHANISYAVFCLKKKKNNGLTLYTVHIYRLQSFVHSHDMTILIHIT